MIFFQLKLLQIAEEEYTKAQNDSLQAQVGVLRFSSRKNLKIF